MHLGETSSIPLINQALVTTIMMLARFRDIRMDLSTRSLSHLEMTESKRKSSLVQATTTSNMARWWRRRIIKKFNLQGARDNRGNLKCQISTNTNGQTQIILNLGDKTLHVSQLDNVQGSKRSWKLTKDPGNIITIQNIWTNLRKINSAEQLGCHSADQQENLSLVKFEWF